MDPSTAAAALSLLGSGIGALVGGKRKTEAAVPEDLAPMRAQNIGMLQFLLGMGRDPRQDMFTSWEDRIPGYSKYKPKTRQKLREQWDRQETRKVMGAPFGGIPAPTTKAAAPPSPQFLPGLPGGPLVRMMADGGMVRGPGGPRDDMVPALLSNGEGVLNTDAVNAVGGPQIIHLLNALSRAPQRMQDGGIAGQATSKPLPTLPGAGALPGAGGMSVSIDKQQPMGGQMGQQKPTPLNVLGAVPGGPLKELSANPTPNLTGGMQLNALAAQGGQLPGYLDQQAIAANPEAYERWRQGAERAGYNYSPTGQFISGPTPTGQQGGGFAMPGQAGMGGGAGAPQGGGTMSQQQLLESFFGPMGINQSNLQQAATAGWMGQLTNISPEQRAAELTLPQLQQNLGGSPFTQKAINRMMGLQAGAGADVEGRLGQLGTGSAFGSQQMENVLGQIASGNQRFGQFGQGPAMGSQQMQDLLGQLASGGGLSTMGQAQLQNLAGAGGAINFQGSGAGMGELAGLAGQNAGERVMAALDPTFQRNLAAANQQGGRFGSANAILRARAAEDFNRQAAEAMLAGAGQQIQAASALGTVGNAQDALRLQALTSGQGTQLGAAQQLAGLGQQQDRLRLEALGLTQSGAQSQQDLALRALLGQQQGQLGALGLGQQGTQAMTDAQLRAMATLGGFRQGEAQTMGNIFQGAGQLGIAQGQLGNQAAQTLAQILGQQGSSDLARLQGAFGAGTVNTGMENAGQQQALQIMRELFGAGLGATLNVPATQTPSTGEQITNAFGGAAQLLAAGGRGGK